MKIFHFIKTILISSTLLSPQAFALTQAQTENDLQTPGNAASNLPSQPVSPPADQTIVSPPSNNQTMAPPIASPMTPPSNNMMQSPPAAGQLPAPSDGNTMPPLSKGSQGLSPDNAEGPVTATKPPLLNDTVLSNSSINAMSLPLVNTEGQPLNLLSAMAPQNTDQDIVAAIKMSIATNNDLSDVDVKVISKNAVVSLIGRLNNYVEANTLIMIAESVPGVKDVDISKLKLGLRNSALSKDAVISAKIKGSFVRQQLFTTHSLTPVRVITFNGAVTLIGKVSNQKQALNAIDIAKSIQGVNKVKSEITVE